MESIRQSKVGKLVQKELAEIFRSEARNLFGGAFITVTVVRLTPDMGLAKVYLSIMDKNKEKNRQKIMRNLLRKDFCYNI